MAVRAVAEEQTMAALLEGREVVWEALEETVRSGTLRTALVEVAGRVLERRQVVL
jgi:hypothetical protein